MAREIIIIPLIEECLKNSPHITSINKLWKPNRFGKWAGKIGQLNMEIVRFGANGTRDLIAPQMGLTNDEFDEMFIEIEKEFNERKTGGRTYRFCVNKKF